MLGERCAIARGERGPLCRGRELLCCEHGHFGVNCAFGSDRMRMRDRCRCRCEVQSSTRSREHVRGGAIALRVFGISTSSLKTRDKRQRCWTSNMTRRTSNVNGTYTNGDAPPPSTLAAQIVQNQTTAAPPQNGETPSFSELLQEILNNHAATPETDVQVNVKLISVVAQAGLGPLTDGNPFTQADTLLSQAADSLAVIESTIRRQPEVLFASTGANGPQLLLPLLSRLLAVCGRQKCEDLPIVRLLDSTFAALGAFIDLWQNAQVLRLVIEDCVNGM